MARNIGERRDGLSRCSPIDKDIKVLPELVGVNQMPTSNFPLCDTVGEHLQKVAADIQKTDQYRAADDDMKIIM